MAPGRRARASTSASARSASSSSSKRTTCCDRARTRVLVVVGRSTVDERRRVGADRGEHRAELLARRVVADGGDERAGGAERGDVLGDVGGAAERVACARVRGPRGPAPRARCARRRRGGRRRASRRRRSTTRWRGAAASSASRRGGGARRGRCGHAWHGAKGSERPGGRSTRRDRQRPGSAAAGTALAPTRRAGRAARAPAPFHTASLPALARPPQRRRQANRRWASRTTSRSPGTRVRFVFARPFYAGDLVQQMDAIGVQSLGIVLLTGFFTGMVLALQSSRAAADVRRDAVHRHASSPPR